MSSYNWFKALEIFSREGYIITVFNYLKGCHVEEGLDLFWGFPVDTSGDGG